ncbi:MAG: DEAD/DEAH box helicase [Planctomycetota bacterium]|nr:MAG: DEAD/DEAH box helicase [Planctomycetota bacterium]
MSFLDLGLSEPLLRALGDAGYTTPTPIQAQAIPPVLAGRDVFGCAQTGTGKTAAFTVPLLQRLAATKNPGRKLRCLILTPTRELAAQIGESLQTYGRHLRLSHSVVFGGVGQGAQVSALRRGVDTLVACPGRLLDLLNQGHVKLDGLEAFILDEADRMLDMGFIHDVKRIIAHLPKQRQTLFFSATVPQEIRELASTLLNDPVDVRIAAVSSAAETVEQSIYHVGRSHKVALLRDLLGDQAMSKTLIFTRTKHGADRVARQLGKAKVVAVAIHGNKTQGQRERALEAFRDGKARVLVASDIAARGIDIDGISHVVNYELPHEPETYVHRIGRTGRAGRSGRAISFCDHDERKRLQAIQKLINRRLSIVHDHPYVGSDRPDDVAPPQGQGRPNLAGKGGAGQRGRSPARPASRRVASSRSPGRRR